MMGKNESEHNGAKIEVEHELSDKGSKKEGS